MSDRKRASLKVEAWPIEQVLPHAKNARVHSDKQIDHLKASIQEFGFVNPCLVDERGELIAGHGRVLAASALGLKTVPVICLGHLSKRQVARLRIADNRIHDLSGFDDGLLAEVLAIIKDDGLEAIGFDDASLAEALARETVGNSPADDDAPEPPAKPVTKPGDCWMLGGHRILCGDATSKDDVATLLGKVRPHLMVTDPPYGVNYDPAWRVRAGTGSKKRLGVVLNDDRADWSEAWKLFPGDVAYVWHGALHTAIVAESLMKSGFDVRSQIIWAKDKFVFGRGDYHWQHEPCWYAVRKRSHWQKDRRQTTIWNISRHGQDGERGENEGEELTTHSTQKPVECMKRPIENNSRKGAAIYEPFSGSGTTIIAAELTGRACYAIEINPAYVDVAILRWQRFTGEKAKHVDGRIFGEAKRRKKNG